CQEQDSRQHRHDQRIGAVIAGSRMQFLPDVRPEPGSAPIGYGKGCNPDGQDDEKDGGCAHVPVFPGSRIQVNSNPCTWSVPTDWKWAQALSACAHFGNYMVLPASKASR